MDVVDRKSLELDYRKEQVLLVSRSCSLHAVLVVSADLRAAIVLCNGDGIAAAEPAVQVDVGATLRTEWPRCLLCGLAADRTGTARGAF